MSLENLGNLGEFIGAIAVLVSVIYLALQIKQNTKSLITQTGQAIMSQGVNTSIDTAANERLMEILAKLSDQRELTLAERMQYSIWMEGVVTNYSQIFYVHQQGSLDDNLLEAAESRLEKILSKPGALEWWSDCRSDFTQEFQDAVDRIIADSAQ
jgi:hypothetical protein